MQPLPFGARGLWALASVLSVLGCSGGTGSNASQTGGTTPAGGAASTADAGTAPSAAGGSATRVLRCAPSTRQLDACSGMAAGASCSLSGGKDGGWSWPGTCRPTFDGTQVACVPNPPTPPAALVSACTGKASGAACEAQGKFGDSFNGTCRSTADGATLFCGREHAHHLPPAVAGACGGLDAGDTCTRPERWDAGSKAGICREGWNDAGLFCGPAVAPGVDACTGLDAGASCTFGFGHKRGWGDWSEEAPTGSCVVPAAGGPASCLVPCEDLRHHRRHGWKGHGGWGWGGGFGPKGADAGTNAP
ncbi:MAG: hypothetical protein ACLQDQ_04545 [Myxococcaceae bacterium]